MTPDSTQFPGQPHDDEPSESDELLDAETIKPAKDTPLDPVPDLPTIVGSTTLGLPTSQSSFGDYELIREIARGGMGVVYQARQISLNRIVAIKMILAGQLASQDDVRRFYVEAEASAKLDHPGIVPIYEIGETEGTHFFSMGYIEGGSLADLLRQGPMRPKDAVRIMSRLCDAMQYAHDHDVIHRDLKPGNILLQATHASAPDTSRADHNTPSSNRLKNRSKSAANQTLSGGSHSSELLAIPKITDFGLAKQLHSKSDLTTTGQILGTPSYMPPEQADGSLERVGPLSDVYSLGAIFYCMLTGRPPFQASSPMETLMQVIQSEPVPPRQLNAATPADLETICLKCLHKDPLRRYASAHAFGEDLNRWLNNEPILARPVSLREKGVLWVRKHQGLAASLALAAAACLLAIGLLFVNWMNRAQQIVALREERDQTAAQERLAKAERLAAEEARTKAQLAEGMALKAKAQTEETNRELESLNNKSAKSLYAATIALAYQEWSQNNVTRAENLLDKTEPSLRNWEWDYLKQLCHSEIMSLRGHAGIPSHVQLHRDRQHAISCGGVGDPFVYVWRLADGVVEAKHAGHGIALSPDGRYFASHDRESRIQLRESLSGRVLWENASMSDVSLLGQFSLDGTRFATVNADRHLRVVDVASGKLYREFDVSLLGDSSELVFAKQGEWILLRKSLDLLSVYEVETGQWLRDLPLLAASDERHQMAISDAQNLIAVASGGDVTLADLDSGAFRGQLSGHTGPVLDMMFAANGVDLVTCGADASVRIWDTKSFKQVRQYRGHRIGVVYGVFSCAMSADGDRVVSGGADRTIKIWDFAKTPAADVPTAAPIPLPNDEAYYLAANRGLVHQLSISADGRWLATAGTEHRAGKVGPKDGATALADLDTNIHHSIRLLDLANRTPAATIPFPKNVGAVSFHPTQSMIAVGEGGLLEIEGGKVETIDISQQSWDHLDKRTRYLGANGPVSKLLFSPNGSLLYAATGSQKLTHRGDVHAWRLENPQQPLFSITDIKGVRDFDISSDGQLLAIADSSSHIRVYRADSGALQDTLTASQASLSVAFSPDGKKLVSGDQNWSIRVIDRETKQVLWERSEHSGAVLDVAYSPDGKRIATASIDKTLRLWDADSGDLLLTFSNAWQEQLSLAYTRQGDAIFSSGSAPYVTGRVVQRRRHLEDSDVASEEWIDIFRDAFDEPELSRWTAHNGTWNVEEGAAHGTLASVTASGFTAATLIPTAWMPSTVSIEFDAWSPQGLMFETKLHDELAVNGMGALHAGLATPFNDGRLGSSLFLQAAGEFNEVAKSDRAFHFEPGQRFHFQTVRRGDRLETFVDGKKMLETSVPSNLFLPFGHLQASFAEEGSEIFVDNVLIRAPRHLQFQCEAIDLERRLHRELKLKELVVEELTRDQTLSPEAKQYALSIAGLRLQTAVERQRVLLSEVAFPKWEPSRFAQAAELIGNNPGNDPENMDNQLLQGALLYRARDYDRAMQLLQSASSQHRQLWGGDHPVAYALEILTHVARDEQALASSKSSRLREWMRSPNKRLTSEMRSLIEQGLESGQPQYAISPAESMEESLRQFTYDRLQTHWVERFPQGWEGSFAEEAQVVMGREANPNAHDISGPWRNWLECEVASKPHRSNPFLALTSLEAAVQLDSQGKGSVTSIVAVQDADLAMRYHVRMEVQHVAGRWVVENLRLGVLDHTPTLLRATNQESRQSGTDWEKFDRELDAVEKGNFREQLRAELKARQFRRASETAEQLTSREEANASDWFGRATTALFLRDKELFLESVKRAVALDPQLEGPDFVRYYVTQNRADQEWRRLEHYFRWRVPNYRKFNLRDVILPGRVVAAWVPRNGSLVAVFIIENAFPKSETLGALTSELAAVSKSLLKAEPLIHRPIPIGDWEAIELVLLGPGNGLAMIPQSLQMDTVQRYVLMRDGNDVIGVLLSAHRDQFVDRSAELQAILDSIEPISK